MGKTRLLEALRDAAAGFRKLHATCEAYTASVPYALWHELLREVMEFGREAPDAAIVDRLREEMSARAPDLAAWLPLVAIAFGIEVDPTPEIELLAESNRRTKLHESVGAFLEAVLPASALVEIENAHQMDEASAELLGYLVAERIGARPWLLAVARRGLSGGFVPPESDTVVRVELKPLAPQDALRMAQLATQQNPLPAHVLDVVAKRSGGNPQFLRDLLRTAIESGGIADLPDSAEAATMAQIDDLAPDDRALVRRASVFGLTFHPRMLAWFAEEGEGEAPGSEVWARLRGLFDEEPDGYLRFRRSLLRDAAYEGLPFKLRRKLHGVVASRLEQEAEYPEEIAGSLSLHYFEAGESVAASGYATIAARHAYGVNAYVEAANLYARALEAARQRPDAVQKEIAVLQEGLGDSWYRAGEFQKASEAYTVGRPLIEGDALAQSALMLKLARLEEKLGNYLEALRWVDQARSVIEGLAAPEVGRQSARLAAYRDRAPGRGQDR
jgi:predicted ATPase